jgi:hypothetical protein
VRCTAPGNAAFFLALEKIGRTIGFLELFGKVAQVNGLPMKTMVKWANWVIMKINGMVGTP